MVSTIYKSETFLERFILELIDAINELQITNFEIVFVLDGITDNSKEFLLNKKKEIPQIKIIELSRNFGHHYAISAGLDNAEGDLIFLIDCDLEVSPKVLVEFKNVYDATNADVVYGIQKTRKGSFVERELGGLFWKTFNALSDTKMPLNVITERLMTKKYLDALKSLGDKNLFLGGMMYWVGFNQVSVEVNKAQREGLSSYGFSKRFNLFIEAITSFSEKPLKMIFKLGLYITCGAFTAIFFMIVRKLLVPETILLGFTSIIVSILFSLGVLTSAIGLVGIYLSRIFKQTQNRPNYIIKNIY
ncbi:MAG: glycosyltransferase family 2 protein [Bacteroidota bacterium]